ncbi:MAG TPA: phage holin family protein [Acidimicrobiia bacterium]|nr:phage holin family protein [Acidimicrobiia bacterium]
MANSDYELLEPDRSLGDLVSQLMREIGDLITAHISLAKAELKQEVSKAGQGAGLLGGGAAAALVAAVMLAMAAAWGLAEIMAPGWAFLIIAVVVGALAVILMMAGRRRMQEVDPVPRETLVEIEKDKEWLTRQSN